MHAGDLWPKVEGDARVFGEGMRVVEEILQGALTAPAKPLTSLPANTRKHTVWGNVENKYAFFNAQEGGADLQKDYSYQGGDEVVYQSIFEEKIGEAKILAWGSAIILGLII